jgi:prepilin-type N-terminal cleavage/methylation domain-containing protein
MSDLAKRQGFTLFELLAVVALMAAVVVVAAAGLRGGGAGAARDAAVAVLASRVAEARQLATSRGEAVRLLVCADPALPERYLRFVAIAVPDGVGWRARDGGSLLPVGAVVLPMAALTTSGPGAVRRESDDWIRGSGGTLRSTALSAYAENGTEPAILGTTRWLMVRFSATGGTSSGDLVVAAGRRQDETVPVTVVCEQPDNVVGLSLSAYGVATFVRGRAEF